MHSSIGSFLDSLKFEQAHEAEMASMVMFSHSKQSRLVRIVGLQGNFPFYGKIETIPDDTYDKVRAGGWAMLDESLASQYEVSTND